jgi:hypothetical protein
MFPEAVIFGFGIMSLPVTCGQAQFLAGPLGPGFTIEQCGIAQALAINTCGCPFEPSGPSSPSSPSAPAVAPAVGPPAMSPSAGTTVFCTVCFTGEPTFSTVAIGGIQCGELDARGRNFEYTRMECLEIQSAAAVAPDDPCDCDPFTDQPTPDPSAAPSPAPSQSPSDRPSTSPSASPSDSPSMSPSNRNLVIDYSFQIAACEGWFLQLWRLDEGATNYVLEQNIDVMSIGNPLVCNGVVDEFVLVDPPDGAQYIIQIQNVDNTMGTGRYVV